MEWRHDVDASLDAAVAMAEMDAAHGVRATFYVMARSPFYNPFSHAGKRAVRRILELGHKLGTHCDLDAPRDSKLTPVDAARVAHRDRRMLAREFPQITRRLSFHCPPDGLLWQDIPSFHSAYAPQWEGRYVADSRGVFAHGDPEDRPDRPLQVNLHPEHWFPHPAPAYEGFWR